MYKEISWKKNIHFGKTLIFLNYWELWHESVDSVFFTFSSLSAFLVTNKDE